MAWEWIAPVGSGVLGVAGLAFGWASSVRSQRQSAALAKEANAHARALAAASNEHARQLEQLRFDQGERDGRRRRLEESSLEIATTVIRLSDLAGAAVAADDVPAPSGHGDELVRTKVLVGLFSLDDVRDAFDRWSDAFAKLVYAVDRLRSAGETAAGDTPVQSVRDLHSTRDMWRRQATDARLREIDARDHLLTAMSRRFRDE